VDDRLGMPRVEAFSDGVIAVIITIMVLEIKPPHDATFAALRAIWPSLAIYALSFALVAAFWVNHHHMLHAAKHADPALMWSNMTLLFFISLLPFVTAYTGEHVGAPLPVVAYGAVLTLTSLSFAWLLRNVADHNSDDPRRVADFQRISRKSYFANSLYVLSMPLAFVSIYISYAIFVFVPLIYVLPDRNLVDPVDGPPRLQLD
jgi:uncharacterized membrane protein